MSDRWKAWIPYGMVIAGVALAGAMYLTQFSSSPETGGIVLERASSLAETAGEEEAGQTQDASECANTVVVYVCGAVELPGVYALSEGSRIVAAIEAAGGLTADAWEEGINLARTVSDGEQIYVPCQEEKERAATEAAAQGKVNLNTATKEQLMELPGIGESKAESILAYRSEHGAFSAPEDVMNVSGIKQSVYEKIREQITVSP